MERVPLFYYNDKLASIVLGVAWRQLSWDFSANLQVAHAHFTKRMVACATVFPPEMCPDGTMPSMLQHEPCSFLLRVFQHGSEELRHEVCTMFSFYFQQGPECLIGWTRTGRSPGGPRQIMAAEVAEKRPRGPSALGGAERCLFARVAAVDDASLFN